MTSPVSFPSQVKSYLHALGVISSVSDGEGLSSAEQLAYIGECDTYGVSQGIALESLSYPSVLPTSLLDRILGVAVAPDQPVQPAAPPAPPAAPVQPAPAQEPVAAPEPVVESQTATLPVTEESAPSVDTPAEDASGNEVPPVDEGFEAPAEENNGTTQE